MPANNTFWNPGESVLLEGYACMPTMGATKNGRLILTNQRLVFITQAMNTSTGCYEIPLAAIAMSGNSLCLTVLYTNIIGLGTVDGRQYQFMVYENQRDMWAQRIYQATMQLRAMSAYGNAARNMQPTEYGNASYAQSNTAPQVYQYSNTGNSQFDPNGIPSNSSEAQLMQKPKKKNKLARILVGILLLVFGLIGIISNGISGANNSDEWFQGSSSAQGGSSVKVNNPRTDLDSIVVYDNAANANYINTTYEETVEALLASLRANNFDVSNIADKYNTAKPERKSCKYWPVDADYYQTYITYTGNLDSIHLGGANFVFSEIYTVPGTKKVIYVRLVSTGDGGSPNHELTHLWMALSEAIMENVAGSPLDTIFSEGPREVSRSSEYKGAQFKLSQSPYGYCDMEIFPIQ